MDFFQISIVIFPILVLYLITPEIIASDSISQFDQLKSQYLPAELARTNFTLEDAKSLLRKKCKKSGVINLNVYEEIEAATIELLQCGKDIGNFTELLSEIEAARPVGNLDIVFQKYCDKRPKAEQCLHDFNAHLLPCLSVEERAQNVIMMRIVSSLLGFLCHRNGDSIAIFIAEEGPECIEAQKENIGNCMNATFAGYMPKNSQSGLLLDELPDFVMSSKQCIDLYDFEECVLGYLEKCNEITPANLIEAMFKYVKNETKCDSVVETEIRRRNSGSTLSFSLILGSILWMGISRIL